jgi:predicted ferric reductase
VASIVALGSLALPALALLALAVLAFWPTYLAKTFAPVDAYTNVHAALGTAWLLLLVAQAFLVRNGYYPWASRTRPPVVRRCAGLRSLVAPAGALPFLADG